jgi:hypothetical protein
MLEATVKRRRRQVCVILYNLAYLNSSDEHVSSRLRRLTPDERLLYHHIDQVQADGIWSKALRAKTNVTQQTLTMPQKLGIEGLGAVSHECQVSE